MNRFFFICCIFLSGCSDNSKEEHSIASGGQLSPYYSFSEKLTSKDSRFNNLETGGSFDNLKLITEQKVSFSILQPDVLDSTSLDISHLKLVTPLHPDYIILISLSESPETIALDEIQDIYAGPKSSGRFASASIFRERFFLNKKPNLVEGNSIAESFQGLINNLGDRKTAALFVLNKESSLLADISDGFLDGYGNHGRIKNKDHIALLKELLIDNKGLGVNFLNPKSLSLKQKTSDLMKLYKFYQPSELKNGIALYKQNALLITHDSIKNSLVKSTLEHTRSILIDSGELCVSITCHAGVPLHEEAARYDMYRATSSHGFAQYFYFFIYLIVFTTSIITLMWLAIYKKSGVLSKITTNKGIISWIVNHRTYSYILIMFFLFYAASLTIKNIEIIEEDALNVSGYFLNLSISDIFSWLLFVITTGLDTGKLPNNNLSQIILILQQFIVIIGIPASIIATSWEAIERFFTGRIGIRTENLYDHIVFIGWRSSFSSVIDYALSLNSNQKFAILSDRVKNPIIQYSLPSGNVGFVDKSPSSEKYLNEVSISQASNVVLYLSKEDAKKTYLLLLLERVIDLNKSNLVVVSNEEIEFKSGIDSRIKFHSRNENSKEFILNSLIKFSPQTANYINFSIERGLVHENNAHPFINEKYITFKNSWVVSKSIGIAEKRDKEGYDLIQRIFFAQNTIELKEAISNLDNELSKLGMKILAFYLNTIKDNNSRIIKLYAPFTQNSMDSEEYVDIISFSLFFVLRDC